MKANRIFFLLGVSVLALSGCNSSHKRGGGGGGSRGSTSEDPAGPEGYEYYNQRYTNKKDCFGNPVDDYHLYDTYGEELAEQIHYYCVDQHTTYLDYSKADYTGKLFNNCDLDPVSGKVLGFYTGREKPTSINREHVWDCSSSSGLWDRKATAIEHKIDAGTYWGGGSDLYNLHICTGNVNSARSNYAFTEFASHASGTEVGDGGPYKLYVQGTKVEADIHYRGNVARILLYMWCHYRQMGTRNVYYPKVYSTLKPVYNLSEAVSQSSTHSPYMFSTGGLKLSQVVGYSDDAQIYAALKKWNKEDPPDEMERHANDYIEKNVQGNRNPFIDYPQLVDNLLDWM